MIMDVIMKLNFDDVDDVADTTEQPVIYQSDILLDLDMSGVSFQEISYTNVNSGSPTLCSSPVKSHDTSIHSPQDTSSFKKYRGLRLFSSPATPKTLLEKCAADSTSGAIRTRRFSKCRFKGTFLRESPQSLSKRKPAQTSNINPFTPTNMYLNKKRSCTRRELEQNFSTSETPLITDSIPTGNPVDNSATIINTSYEEDELRQVKKLSFREANVTRYRQEFLEYSLLGKGQFGGVYKCKHRLDGCIYAIKKSLKPIAGSVCERTALNEVYAHAVLGKHPHVVRYYSAWAEENHMLIQNEYCNGGSLSSRIIQNLQNKQSMCEPELKQILLHVAKGLKYIHFQQLVHMDIKPDNIFIVKEPKLIHQCDESADDGFEEEVEDCDEQIQYKIGDLGHVTSVIDPKVEEGDCRYLSKEILQEDFRQLQKSDIFALGLTIYEAASGNPLPLNGEEWHDIRNGNVKEVTSIGADFQNLLKLMIHPDPHERPTATQVIQQLSTNGTVSQSHQLLRRELQAEKMKNELLSKQLSEATKCLKSFKDSPTLSLNAAIASGVLAGVSRSPARTRLNHSRSRNTRSVRRKYKINY